MKKFVLRFVAAVLLLHCGYATVPPVTGSVPEHLRPYLAKIQKEYQSGYWAQRMSQRTSLLNRGMVNQAMLATDTVNVPVLMGTYSNSSVKYSPQVFQELLFDGPNPTGTLTQFYLENSYGKLYMTGKALGWFATPRTFDYYVHDGGTNNAGLNYGGRDFTIDLLVEADKTVDFSKYVKYVDADGPHVPYVAIIHTGGDAASGADNIWSHRWNVRGRLIERKNTGTEPYFDVTRVRSDGKYITNDSLNGQPVIFDGDYAIQPELAGSSNTSGNPKQIGVFTHEFGHIFGLPDLYDTDNSSAGLGNWCLMAGGSYGGDGSHEGTPAHMSAWCKVTLGWVTPTVISAYTPNQAIKYVEKYPEVYKINVRNTAGGQYFLLENRQKVGYDFYLANSGLLIFHIDPSRTTNSNENRRLVDLEQADGSRHLNVSTSRGDAGDPYPGSSNNRVFDGYSVPDSRDYALAQSYVGVRNISNSDSIMYADIDVGTRPYIVIRSIAEKEGGTNNNNGRIDVNESGSVSIKMENIYPVNLTSGTVQIKSPNPEVVVDTNKVNLTLNGLDTTTVTIPSAITVPNGTTPKKITLNVTVQTADMKAEKSYEMFIGYPRILLMDLDTVAIDNITSYYESALAEKQKYFERVGLLSGNLANALPNRRDILIVYSGRSAWNILSDSIANVLTSFLDIGGQVFISGQNIAEDLKKRNSPYAASLLRSSWKQNILFGRILNGVASDLFGGALPLLNVAGGNGAKNQASPDQLDVDTLNAHPSFRWNSTTGTPYGGLWWENPAKGSKLVFWSFGFEAINDSAVGANSRSQALGAILNWFTGVTSTPDYSIPSGIPYRYALAANYPNPFNPSTTIRYSLQQDGFVSLKVYDMLGKEVATVVNAELSAGDHAVHFDASRLASGVYLYRLTAGHFSETKKMVLMK